MPRGHRSSQSTSVFPVASLRNRAHDLPNLLVRHADEVVHVLDAGHPLDNVGGPAFGVARPQRAGERDFTVADADVDLGCVDVLVLGQALADVFANALVRALIAARSAATILLSRASAFAPSSLAPSYLRPAGVTPP